ncbi:GNAT family N-acetyltransferase [Mesoplasma melaleucae]|uniref:[citrate (Pro-3S)-lyase] ligase n=1 Tax=Mesoplasma melaleucae TaxID=81459 RepID=A0A2K8NVR1_9MOLU|nr:GNAT family N-acetyltransferase [Mesoplasma melaleucae]ATZ17636.1 [citrate (pro-3S)-lyase] ligase [Mesoplasma melaleucae]
MSNIVFEKVNLENQNIENKVKIFLNKFDLKYSNIDCTIIAWEANEIIGVCSKNKNIIKNIAVDDSQKGLGLFNQLLSEIKKQIIIENYNNTFVITKKCNKKFFEDINFKKIYENDKIAFLAENIDEYNNYKKFVNNSKFCKKTGVILLNANPLTKGHQFLIEESRKENDLTVLIPVIDDSSFFTTKERLEILSANYQNSKDIKIFEGTQFLISKKLFPSYFIKSDEDVITEESEMNAWLFKDIFSEQVKSGNTITRYLGSEPFSKTTNKYNEFIQHLYEKDALKIKVKIVERYTNKNNDIISASKVRKLIYDEQIDKLKDFVSDETFKLITKDEIIERAQAKPELIFKNN